MCKAYDMHNHLGFCEDPALTARELKAREVAGGLCCTVTPKDYAATATILKNAPDWNVGIGAHPWWADKLIQADLDDAREYISQGPCFLGEVGLDFSERHKATQEQQLSVFKKLIQAIQPGSLLSIHAVKSANLVLDILEKEGVATSCLCIFHWFSGSGTELHRAVQAGSYFSVGALMLRSRRGREYARQIPLSHLLLETDYPDPNRPQTAKETACDIYHALKDARAEIARLRMIDCDVLANQLNINSEQLLHLFDS